MIDGNFDILLAVFQATTFVAGIKQCSLKFPIGPICAPSAKYDWFYSPVELNVTPDILQNWISYATAKKS